MLFERIDSEHLQETESFEEPTALNPAAPCLLHRLQSDLLDGDWQEKTAEESSVLDSSLSFVSCYSAVQELMVLKDQILYWLQDNPDMELCDIVVMAPDIQEYAPIIPAIFHDIQHSIADRSARQHDSGLEIFFQFLDLAVSRCSWSAVLDLLEKPEIALAFGDLSESDLELIRHWVLGSGIRWGLSGDGLHSEGIPELADISWQAGLDRLLLGYAMDCQEPVPSKGILPQGHFPPRALSPKGTFPQEHFLQGTCGAHGILPYPDIEGSQAEPLGGLCQFLELLERASRDFTHPRPLAAWSSLLLSHARSLFGSDQEKTLGQLREILTTLGEYGADNNSSPKGTLPQGHFTPRALYPKGTSFGAPSGRLRGAFRTPPGRQQALLSLIPLIAMPSPWRLFGPGLKARPPRARAVPDSCEVSSPFVPCCPCVPFPFGQSVSWA